MQTALCLPSSSTSLRMTPPMCMSPFTRRRFSTLRSVTNMRSSQLPSLTRLCVNMLFLLARWLEVEIGRLMRAVRSNDKGHTHYNTHSQQGTNFDARTIIRLWQRNDEWTDGEAPALALRRRLANISSQLVSLFSCCCFLGIDSFSANIVGVWRRSEE